MSIISSIITSLATSIGNKVINQALPDGQLKNFNEGWRKVVSYILGISVASYIGSMIIVTTAHAVGTLFGHPLTHYAEFITIMGGLSLADALMITGALLGWTGLNVAHNAVINAANKK